MLGTISDPLVSGMLLEYGAITRSMLSRYLPSREPRRYLYDLVADYPSRGGRMLRASLCLATAQAFGAPLERALRTAVSQELAHDARLVHRDAAGDREKRRGRPALHKLSGLPLAINAGVTLTLMSLRPLLENEALLGGALALRIVDELRRTAEEGVAGETREKTWRRNGTLGISDKDYLEMLLLRDCWPNAIGPCRIGGLIAGCDEADLDRFASFGFFLGAALQLHDELHDLDDAAGGSPVCGGLGEGRRSLALLHLYRTASDDERIRLRKIFASEGARPNPDQLRWVQGLLAVRGSLDYVREIASGLAAGAVREHRSVFGALPDSRSRYFLGALAASLAEDPTAVGSEPPSEG